MSRRSFYLLVFLVVFLTVVASPSFAADSSANGVETDPLVRLLTSKGVITSDEASAISAVPSAQRHDRLLKLLHDKGVISSDELSFLTAPRASAQVSPVLVASISPAVPPSPPASIPPPDTRPTAPTVVPAIAPLRVLPLDPPVKDGLIPGFKLGAVKVTPYGFIKATVVHDTSAPNGDDFPFPGIFLNSSSVFSTGPTTNPSFHLKARSTRFGANFEWPDIAKNLTLTGKVEGDLEGNFSGVDNADVSSIRNPGPRLRLAYVRLDYAASEKTDLFFEGGQNWTLFGSSALPNIVETTFLGAYSGDVWERAPQMRFGLVQKLGGERNFKLSPEFALMMPSTGQIYKLNGTVGGFEAQIGEGERQGADSGRPELEARVVLQFQLDKAPGVAPAQIIWAGFDARRTSITTALGLAGGNYTSAQQTALTGTSFQNGFTASSNLFGNQFAIQLPTRWFTVVASAYRGGDLRFMLGGQLDTNFTDVSGLYQVQSFATVDGVAGTVSGASMLGCTVNAAIGGACTTAGGKTVVAREHPVGAFGGFVNLGLPLSRWFNADPKGHNAGWQLYLHAGKDQVVHRDLLHANGIGCASADGLTSCNGGLPIYQSTLAAATLYYKLNQWVSFAFEQSRYGARLLPEVPALYHIAGKQSHVWQDQRTEFGPIFTF